MSQITHKSWIYNLDRWQSEGPTVVMSQPKRSVWQFAWQPPENWAVSFSLCVQQPVRTAFSEESLHTFLRPSFCWMLIGLPAALSVMRCHPSPAPQRSNLPESVNTLKIHPSQPFEIPLAYNSNRPSPGLFCQSEGPRWKKASMCFATFLHCTVRATHQTDAEKPDKDEPSLRNESPPLAGSSLRRRNQLPEFILKMCLLFSESFRQYCNRLELRRHGGGVWFYAEAQCERLSEVGSTAHHSLQLRF